VIAEVMKKTPELSYQEVSHSTRGVLSAMTKNSEEIHGVLGNHIQTIDGLIKNSLEIQGHHGIPVMHRPSEFKTEAVDNLLTETVSTTQGKKQQLKKI
jgi:hypothetical protein